MAWFLAPLPVTLHLLCWQIDGSKSFSLETSFPLQQLIAFHLPDRNPQAISVGTPGQHERVLCHSKSGSFKLCLLNSFSSSRREQPQSHKTQCQHDRWCREAKVGQEQTLMWNPNFRASLGAASTSHLNAPTVQALEGSQLSLLSHTTRANSTAGFAKACEHIFYLQKTNTGQKKGFPIYVLLSSFPYLIAILTAF